MKLRLIALVSAVALVAAACGDSSQAVATVNGFDITAEYMASLRESSGQSLNVNTEEFRNELSQNIIRVAIVQAAADEFGIEVGDDEIEERIANPPPRWQSLFDELEADPDTTDAFAESQAELTILRDRVTAELIRSQDGFLERTITETPQDVSAGCVRHILVESQLEAQAVVDRLAAGDDFVALAEELSIDTISGGNVVGGCPVGFGGFVPNFAFAAATAPINEVVGPIQTEFGFHVLRVEQRVGPPTLEELEADPIVYYPGVTLSGFFTPWFNDAVRNAEITVADSVGRWSADGVGILPPGQ